MTRQYITGPREKGINFEAAIVFSRVKPRMEKAIRLVKLGGLKPSQVAKELGVTRQAVHQAVKRFDKLCAELISQFG